MKIKLKIILQIISILLGLLYCSFIIWNRLFRTRQLRDLIHEVDTSIIIIYAILFVVTLIILLYNIKLALRIKTSSKIYAYIEKKPFILNSLAFLEQYILNAPKNLYEFLFKVIYIRPLMQHICYNMIEHQEFYDKAKNLKIIIYVINILKLIVALAFIYDILFVGKFIHFFKFLPLLMIPIIFEVFLYMIYHFSNISKITINQWIYLEVNEENTGYIVSLQKEYENDPELTDEVALYHAQNWQAYVISMEIIDRYYELEKKIKPYFNIIRYSIYSIGWLYLLYNIWIL